MNHEEGLDEHKLTFVNIKNNLILIVSELYIVSWLGCLPFYKFMSTKVCLHNTQC